MLRHGLLENPYAMRERAAEDVRTRYAAFLGNDTFPTAGWLEAVIAVAEARLECAVVQPIILERSVTHDDNTLHVWWHPLRLLDHEDGRSPHRSGAQPEREGGAQSPHAASASIISASYAPSTPAPAPVASVRTWSAGDPGQVVRYQVPATPLTDIPRLIRHRYR